jgi:hypothetical protein
LRNARADRIGASGCGFRNLRFVFLPSAFLCVLCGSTLLLFPPGMALAQLSWENKLLDFHPTFEEKSVTGEFVFKNAGNYPVKILSVKSNCGCTTAKLDKTEYQPGESGKITATFTIGQRVGFQQKDIIVRTDDPHGRDGKGVLAQLTVQTHIPELARVTPKFVNWQIGETNAPKTIALEVKHSEPIHVVGVESSDARLIPKLATIEDGKRYEVLVTPADTSQPVKAHLRIKTDFPKDKPRLFHALAQVK